MYVADDGAEFESRQKCIKYNQKLHLDYLKTILKLDSRKIEMPYFEGNDWYYFTSYKEIKEFLLATVYYDNNLIDLLKEAETFNFPDWISVIEYDSDNYINSDYEIYSLKKESEKLENLKTLLHFKLTENFIKKSKEE